MQLATRIPNSPDCLEYTKVEEFSQARLILISRSSSDTRSIDGFATNLCLLSGHRTKLRPRDDTPSTQMQGNTETPSNCAMHARPWRRSRVKVRGGFETTLTKCGSRYPPFGVYSFYTMMP